MSLADFRNKLQPFTDPRNILQKCPVLITSEKGSDVNLATHLLSDAYEKEISTAIIISNDSDLKECLKIVKERCGVLIKILNPQRKKNKFSGSFNKIVGEENVKMLSMQ